MVVKETKIWLEPADKKSLLQKAKDSGFEGKGSISKYIRKIAREQICFLDSNVKSILGLLSVK